ncbi:putative galactokinase [Naematelia encephala]|uniref:Galactokinase n=1 Tax=Naematelia encephala TaxID=71784 RepID=A0A1Y2B0D8_9TREE|nr:putative galactokinase [Naematelia encephala]
MAAQLPIPFFSSLSEIYPSDSAVLREGKRWNDLVVSFQARYGSRPTHIIRAPGRVNILGEHIDYSLFPVLPAAIEQDILLALRVIPTSPPTVKLANVESKFKPTAFELTPPESSTAEWQVDFVSPKHGGGWDNYVKVAIAECLQRYFKDGSYSKEPVGMELLMDGDIPAGAGLSSSAAFVVSSVIVFLVANGLTEGVSKGDVVRLAMDSEHRMGLQTGGMDQAASALSLSNALLHLSFHPTLLPEPLPLPAGVSVVITNSLAPHALTNSAPEHYNLRVVETLCAARLLLHAWGLDEHPRVRGKIGSEARIWLREVLDLWVGEVNADNDIEVYTKALEDVQKYLAAGDKGERGWTREEMIQASGMSVEDFTLTYLDFIEIRAETFYLAQRSQHAFTESIRVSKFTAICRSPTPSLETLGQLLDESHSSCKYLNDCTVPQTDELQQLCKSQGALGSRQTGGGWGGAVISLVKIQEQEKFLKAIKSNYGAYKGLSDVKLNQAAFATLPGNGAGVYVIDGDIEG